jgi:hypothetical protein
MGPALFLLKSADPSGPGIVVAMPTKYLMDLIDQLKSMGPINIFSRQ